MQIEELHRLFLKFPKIATDTRTDIKESVFFCLSGENFNGNQFAAKALEKGAALVLVDDKNFWLEDSRYILVENCLSTLQQLAAYHRKQFSIPILGITGTNGKTTTKELINEVLSAKYNVTATEGNLNNHIGVPLTLLKINQQSEIAIIEMGANHPDEIEFLCSLALPNYGLITNIGKAHLEGFGSLEAIRRTKLALYKAVIKQNGTLFVNFDDEVLKAEAKTDSCFSYGQDLNYDVHATITENFPLLGLEWGTRNQENAFTVNSKLFGNYNIDNIIAAISVGLHFGLSPEIISEAIEGYQPKNNRSQFLKGKKNELVLDAYNANPASLKIALSNFIKDKHKQKAVILGDMFELGDYSSEEHRIILQSLQISPFQLNLLVGPRFKQFEKEYPDFHFFENTNSLIKSIDKLDIKNMRILVKGSRGVKLEVLEEYLK